MTYNIIACGETGSKWDGTGLSIGVNDCWKFGKATQSLLICNQPARFSRERLEVITRSRPLKFYTNSHMWKGFFSDYTLIKLRSWDGHLRKDVVQHTDTSPFVAMSLAYQLGATKIVLWGVDFTTHHIYNTMNGNAKMEVRQYRQFIDALRLEGVDTYLGARGGLLEEFLTVYHE